MVRETEKHDKSFEPVKLFKNDEKPVIQKNKSNLTPAQKNRIKRIAEKCELPPCTNGPYEVHHIRFLEEDGKDYYRNLIVLCSNHHDDAHGKNPDGKNLLKPQLYKIVKERSNTKSDQIREVLRKKKSNRNSSKSKPRPSSIHPRNV